MSYSTTNLGKANAGFVERGLTKGKLVMRVSHVRTWRQNAFIRLPYKSGYEILKLPMMILIYSAIPKKKYSFHKKEATKKGIAVWMRNGSERLEEHARKCSVSVNRISVFKKTKSIEFFSEPYKLQGQGQSTSK